jgi:glutamate racemase
MRTVGIFDSGVGGLTVVRAVRDRLPGAAIHYLGDTARVPYGSKSPRTVERYSLACLRFLLEREVDLVLVACNTASANALDALSAATPTPVIGAVLPGARAAVAASQTGRIGVLGTLSTVRSRAYESAIAELSPAAAVAGLACPLLVPLAEEGWTDGEIAEQICHRYLVELFAADPDIDTLVLGCTHYPLLADTISRVAADIAGRPIAAVDSASTMADEAAALGPTEGDGRLRCYVTDATRLDELGARFLGSAIDEVELVDL